MESISCGACAGLDLGATGWRLHKQYSLVHSILRCHNAIGLLNLAKDVINRNEDTTVVQTER